MPYILCPTCGATTHLSVRDQKAWYEERYPGTPIGALVPGRCIDCWPELLEGDVVTIRDVLRNRTDGVGERGSVVAVRVGLEDAAVFEIKLESGKTLFCVRAELRKRREGES